MRFSFINIIFFISTFTHAQRVVDEKHTEIFFTDEKITIDGNLDEAAWSKSVPANTFFCYDPINGDVSLNQTEVKILYDHEAIYIAAFMHDSEPSKILKEFTNRDMNNANADAFWVSLNPYADGQNFFQFSVTSVNIQTDLKYYAGTSDYTWDAVWESATKINDNGWIAEIKIPFSAIRFSNAIDQIWDINYWRLVRRTREISSWNFVDKKLGNIGAQMGKLDGIKNIESPLRLSLFPYISGFVQQNQGNNNVSWSGSGGMDIKYGINESFTLDMALIPDFSQTKSDDKILNLSPYEIKYGENRQFFTEGTELFNKAGLFYSRRIGDIPGGYYDVDSIIIQKGMISNNPTESRLLNTTKVSGRSKNNLGLGFFNAITGNTYASATDSLGNKLKLLTEPLTNFNILVADQTIRENSFVNIINTNKYQPSTGNYANVTGTAFKIFEKNNLYAIYGNSAVSVKHDLKLKDDAIGEACNLNIGKLNGNLVFNYGFNVITDKYNPNDIGYLVRNNDLTHSLSASYRIYTPFWKMNYWSCNFSYYYRELYSPRSYSQTAIHAGSDGTFNNYFSYGIGMDADLKKIHDYYEPRITGRFFEKSGFYSFTSWFSTDYRNPLAFDWTIDGFTNAVENESWSWSFAPRIRVSDHFLFTYTLSSSVNLNDKGFVKTISQDSIIMGMRDVKSMVNTFSGSYVINNKMYVSLNIRHYRTAICYSDFYILQENGQLKNDDSFIENHDINYNTFTIDMSYSWNFAPGSYLNIMWKNNITKNEIVNNKNFDNFFTNFDRTINFPQLNSLSVKLSYFLDYQKIIRN